MNTAKTLQKVRFVPCANGAGVLNGLSEAAVRIFFFAPMNETNLTRREICRGKISLRNTQPKPSIHLEERTLPALLP
jgi:hypothetical protein